MGGEILIEIAYIGSDLDSIDLSVCPLIQEHRMSSFLFGYFKFLLFILYIFQCTSSFIALLTFICRYLVLSDAIENGTGFYIVRHGFSLLWYRNSTDFCMFILRPANLLSVFVVTTSRFMVDSFLYIQLCYL